MAARNKLEKSFVKEAEASGLKCPEVKYPGFANRIILHPDGATHFAYILDSCQKLTTSQSQRIHFLRRTGQTVVFIRSEKDISTYLEESAAAQLVDA